MAMESLIAAASRGSSEAQEKLIRHFTPEVSRYIDRQVGARVRRQVSVSDLSQEVFVRVFRTLESLPEGCTIDQLRGRLFKNARWVIANQARSGKRFVGESVLAEGAEGQPDESSGETTGDVTRADQVAWLRSLAERLDPKYARVIQLRMAGFEFAEIADQLEEKEATVRKRFQRAQEVLQRLLSGRLEADG